VRKSQRVTPRGAGPSNELRAIDSHLKFELTVDCAVLGAVFPQFHLSMPPSSIPPGAGAKSAPLDAFASLIADSESLRHPERTAAEVARTVQSSVSRMRARIDEERKQSKQAAREKAAVQRRADRQKRLPAWLIDAQPHQAARAWTVDDDQQLHKLLYSNDSSLCRCSEDRPQKRRRDSQPAAASEDSSSPACCCYQRFSRIAERMHRTPADVERRMRIGASLGADAASSIHSLPASALPVLSAESIARSWSEHVADDGLMPPTHCDWQTGVGPILAVPPLLHGGAQWSEERTHELLVLVREQRAALLPRKQANRTAASASDRDVSDRDGDPSSVAEDDVADLPPAAWEFVASHLHPPSHPTSARRAYFAVLQRGSAIVPAASASHLPFYFPGPQARFNREIQRLFSLGAMESHSPADSSSDTGDEPQHDAWLEDDDAAPAAIQDDSEEAQAARHEEVIRAVRRLSKRYRA
jgi:hypothetical protein